MTMPPYTMVQVTVVSPQKQAAAAEDSGGDTSVTTNSTGDASSSNNNNTNTNPSFINETVRGIKDVAGGSMAVLKEWAASPQRGWKSPSDRKSSRGTTDATKAEEDLAWYESLGRSASSEDRQAAQRALQDLMSPFMACHGGGDYAARTETQQRNQHASVHISRTMGQGMSHFKDSVFANLQQADSDTVISLDTCVEDEMMQLQRLTSWGTNASLDTTNTEQTNETATTAGDEAPRNTITDDDGHVIPQVLLQAGQKRREKRRRKRVVRFDYPPISSLRECPRPDPNDLPDLFFTEEELDEIEADRCSAVAVDDIEIVAVASNKSQSSSARSSFDDVPSNSYSGEESSGKTTPRLQRKPRVSSPHPRRPAPGTFGKEPSSAPPTTPTSDPRLIKGVQIYLRERSTGKGGR